MYDSNGGPDARQECPCSNTTSGYDPYCDVHGHLRDHNADDVAFWREMADIYWEGQNA